MNADRVLPTSRLFFIILVACLALHFHTASPAAEEISGPVDAETQAVIEELNVTDNCAEAVALLKTQNKKISQEFRQVKREIAALKEAISKPGLKEVFGGIGYILGFLGIIFYFQAKRHSRTQKG